MSDIIYKTRQEQLVDIFVCNLIPINNWSKLEKGVKIFHKLSNHPNYYDIFEDMNEDKTVMGYLSSVDGQYYTHSLSGWYLWDEEEANQFK